MFILCLLLHNVFCIAHRLLYVMFGLREIDNFHCFCFTIYNRHNHTHFSSLYINHKPSIIDAMLDGMSSHSCLWKLWQVAYISCVSCFLSKHITQSSRYRNSTSQKMQGWNCKNRREQKAPSSCRPEIASERRLRRVLNSMPGFWGVVGAVVQSVCRIIKIELFRAANYRPMSHF